MHNCHGNSGVELHVPCKMKHLRSEATTAGLSPEVQQYSRETAAESTSTRQSSLALHPVTGSHSSSRSEQPAVPPLLSRIHHLFPVSQRRVLPPSYTVHLVTGVYAQSANVCRELAILQSTCSVNSIAASLTFIANCDVTLQTYCSCYKGDCTNTHLILGCHSRRPPPPPAVKQELLPCWLQKHQPTHLSGFLYGAMRKLINSSNYAPRKHIELIKCQLF